MTMKNLKKKVYLFIDKMTGTYKEEIVIPESWLNPEIATTEVDKVQVPVAVEPTVVFDKPRKSTRPMLGVPWVRLKRLLAILMLVFNVFMVVGSVITQSYVPALVYYTPMCIVLADYLYVTRDAVKVKWYVLDNIEDDK